MTKIRATVRSKKNKLSTRQMNIKKMDAVMNKFIPAVYDLNVEFVPSNNDGEFHFDDFLPTNLQRLEMGSGYCMLTGCRDYHFRGTKEQMVQVMQAFCRSPFKVHKFYVYPDGDHFEEYNEKMSRRIANRAAYDARRKKDKKVK